MSGYYEKPPKSGKRKKGSFRKNKAEQISRPWEYIGREGFGPLKGPIVKRLGVPSAARPLSLPCVDANAITGMVIYTLSNKPF